MIRLRVPSLLVFCLAFVPAARAQITVPPGIDLPYRYIAGMEVFRLNRDVLIVARGSVVDNTGRSLIQVRRAFHIDIRVVGDRGRDDVATPDDVARNNPAMTADPGMPSGFRASRDGTPAPGWYHLVYLGSKTTAEGSAMLTRQISSTRNDRPGDARAPAPYTERRHAPVAYYFDEKSGFRPQVCYGWPQPMCVFTSAGVKKEFAIVEDFRSTAWRTIELERFMPDSARIIRIQAVVRGVSSGGAAYARSLAHRDGDVLMGTVGTAGERHSLIFEIATNSKETIAIRTDEGVSVSLYAVGFAMAQTY